MPLEKIKQQHPEWSTLSDDQIVDMVHQLDYQDLTRDQVAKGLGVKLAAPPMPERSMPAFLNDQAINIGNSAAGIVKTGVDFFAPDSAMSKGIGDFIQSGQDMQSDKQKRLNADLQANLQSADGPLAKAGAYVKHAVLADPAKTIADTVGNFGPFMGVGKVAQAAKLGEAGSSALSMGVGAVSGAGEVRGNIYDKINSTSDADLQAQSPEYRDLRVNKGLSEQEAKSEIGANFGRNLPEVLAAGAVGALSGKFGVEGMAAKVAPKTGKLASAGIGLLDEASQGGIEQLTTNIGVQRAIPSQSLGEDIPLNMAMEGLPGLLGGAMHGGHAPKVQDNGPLSRAANTALEIQHQEAQRLALPAPTIQVTPSGTAVTSAQRGDLIQQALDARQGGIFDITPVPQAPSEAPKTVQGPQEQIDQSLANIDMWGKRAAPVPLGKAQDYKVQFSEQGRDVTVIPHPAGEGFTVVPSAWLAPFMRNGVQQGDLSGMLPSPAMAVPGAPLVAGMDGIRQQTYGDQQQSRAIQSAQQEEADRKASIGLTPDVERAQVGSNVPVAEVPRVAARAVPLNIGFDNAPTGRMVAGPDGVVAETQADRINRESARKARPGDRLNPAGNPFKNKHAANMEQKRSGGDVIPVDGGWVVRPAAQTVEASNGITGDTARVPERSGAYAGNQSGAGMGVQRSAVDGADRVSSDTAINNGQSVERADAGQPSSARDAQGLSDVQNAPQSGAGVSAQAKSAQPKAADAQGTGQDAAGKPAGGVPAAGPAIAQADGVKGKAPLFTRKLLPSMSDEELQQAKAYYGPEHKRTEKIDKEIAKRGIQDMPANGAGEQSPAPKLAGDKIDAEWTAFHTDSGTLGIPRAEMPQIKAEHRGALVNFLAARGIKHEQSEVQPSTLKPTQAEFSPAKVQKAKEFTGGDRSILVSQDDHVVDGHHQWVAKQEAGEPVKVIRLKAPIREVLEQVKEFPSAEQQDGAAEAQGNIAAMPESTKPGPNGEQRTGADQGNAAAAAKQIAEAIAKDDDAGAAYGIRVIPGDYSDELSPGDSLPPSNRWVDGEDTGEPIAGTSAIRINGSDGDAVLRALKLAGADGNSGPNGFYWGNRVALVKGDSIGSGEDVGEILLKDATIVDLWNKPTKGKSSVFANEQTAPESQGANAAQAGSDATPEPAPASQQDGPGASHGGDAGSSQPEPEAKAADPQDTPQVSEAEARKRLTWRDMGQSGGEKTWGLYYDDGDGRGMRYGTVSKFAGSRWSVDGHDGGKYEGLQPAKTKAEDLAVIRLKVDGFVKQSALEQALGVEQANAPTSGAEALRKQANDLQNAARKMLEGIEPGQPVMSARDAAKRYRSLEKSRKAAELLKQADQLDSKDQLEATGGIAGATAGGPRPTPGGFDAKAAWDAMTPSQRFDMLDKWAGAGQSDMGPRYKDRTWDSFNAGERSTLSAVLEANAKPAVAANDRDAFTLERQNKETGRMEPVKFERGEYVKVWINNSSADFGEIDGISQAKREFSVNGLWHTMGAAYKAERPAAPVKKTEPLSKTIEKMNAKNGEGLTDADRVPEKKPASKTPTVDRHMEAMEAVRNGSGSLADYQANFAAVSENEEAVKAELAAKTKEELLRAGGAYFHMRYKSETKPDIIKAFYAELLEEYALGKSYGPNSYIMTGGGMAAHRQRKREALKTLVEAQTQEDLDNFAKEIADRRAENKAERAAKQAAMDNPQTLSDYRSLLSSKIREGMTRAEAFLTLTPEQRIKYDELEAESTRESREARKRAAKTEVRAAGQATGGDIVATKNTRDGHDLWVVRLSDRLSTEDYKTVLASAKRMGGSYSSFRGNGAVPGFQFRTPEPAQAFLKLAGGDTSEAQGLAEQRRDAFEDDRSQSAVERLSEMADKLEDRAQEALDRDRKTNTARRARFAASADRDAQEAKALAKTMRNIAKAIEEGRAKFLDGVRTKSQVELLRGRVATAKQEELRAKYPSYADQEKRRGEPATAETADFAEFPTFSAFRSDLASLARQMLEVDGTKKLGQQLMSVADDVTDAYIEFAKKPENLYKLSTFSIRQGDDVKAAIFPSKDAAERAIRRSGLADRAIVLAEKRGVNRIIMSPSEAMSRGVWTGDGDKRITLTGDAGAALVEAIGRRGNKTNRLAVPWQFQTAHDRRNALKRIGIETPSEYRSALREFIGLQEQAIVNKVRELELSMAGRKNDGLDFFPTPAEVADQMVAAADITPDMAVLEPSAGMGHIADRIREAGAEPDVIELAEDRRELLQEKGYNLADFRDFLDMKPRQFFTYGDVFRAPDGAEGVMSGSGGMGSSRVILKPLLPDGSVDSRRGEWHDRDGLVGVRHRGTESGYDRIIMNPPFSNGRDIEHVMHAYDLLKPGGRIVAIMGESAFFNQSKKAEAFRQWLDDKGGTSEKLPAGSFMDPSLPVNTGVNARMVVIDKSEAVGASPDNQAEAGFSRQDAIAAIAHMDMVEDMVGQLVKGWKNAPEIVVMRSMEDAPDAVRQENERQVEGGAVGEPKAFFHNGKAYVMASQMRTMADVRQAVFHETLGHLGLRGLYGSDLAPILDQVWNARRGEVQAKAKAYGLNTENVRDRRMAAEEWLADIAQDNPSMGFIRRAVAAIRGWLRRNVPSMADLPMSDDEVIRDFILPAQRFIKKGPTVTVGRLAPAFKRDDIGMARSEGMSVSVKRDESGERVYAAGGVSLSFPIESERFEVIPGPDQKIMNYAIMPTDSFDVLGNMEVLVENGQPISILDINVDGKNNGVGAKAVGMLLAAHPQTDMNVSNIIPTSQGFWEKMGVPTQNLEEGAAYDGTINHAAYLEAQRGRGTQGVLAANQGPNRQTDTRAEGGAPQALGGEEVGFSRSAVAQGYAEQARNAFSDFMGSAGTQVDWLDKTLKTQYAKAQKFPEFGKVFNKLQEYIEGVSSMANQAADQAPSILPKLDTFSDLWEHGGILGHGLSKADRKAVAAPIFEGTLNWTRDARGNLVRIDDLGGADEVTPGVVFTPSELRNDFGLNETQIGQYQEFRKAVNESLDQVVATEISRFIPDLPASVAAMAQTSEGRQKMQGAVEDFLGGEAHPQWVAVQEKYAKVESLKDRGYAPLSRFGKHFVHVVVDGETKFFGLEESVYKANALARDLRQEFKGATVEQGVISQEQYKLMSAVPLDAMELFAEALGAEKSEVFQQYIQLAKNNRSTMKRLIHRKGTAGFSQDVPRVLANFITSNARASSAALHIKGAKDMAQAIRQGDVKDEAVKLIGAVTEPEESGAAVRGLMFTNFIGGSIASAVVNLTQPVMMTMPYLSQWGGGVKASARLVAAAKMAITRKGGDTVLNDALKRAEDDGIVAPQEIHHLIQRAVGGMADKNPVLQKLAFVWGAPFSLAESFNRRATFIAAFQTAREEGIADPFGFAEKAVVETQGLYNSGNKPNAARGVAGATVMTFKQFSIHYLEWLSRMAKAGPQGKRAAVLALVMLMLAAGADGLPFMDDMDDVIDTAGQAMGYDTNTKRWRHKAIADVLGDELGEVASRGFSAASGMPIDVSVRMGMGNLIPASDLLMKSNTDTARSLAELAGAGGGLFTQYRDAVKAVLDGDLTGGIMKVAPVALQNVAKAAQMASTGEYRDTKGRKVVDADGVDVGAKLLGFQPSEVARESSRLGDMRQSETLAKLTESEVTDKWARAIADGDKEAERSALDMRDSWNEKNPESPISVKRSQAIKKARQLALDRKARFIKTVGKERRAAAKQELES